jgi:hypothetical protein
MTFGQWRKVLDGAEVRYSSLDVVPEGGKSNLRQLSTKFTRPDGGSDPGSQVSKISLARDPWRGDSRIFPDFFIFTAFTRSHL